MRHYVLQIICRIQTYKIKNLFSLEEASGDQQGLLGFGMTTFLVGLGLKVLKLGQEDGLLLTKELQTRVGIIPAMVVSEEMLIIALIGKGTILHFKMAG